MRVGIIMPVAEQRGGAEGMFLHLVCASTNDPDTHYSVAFLEDGPMVLQTKALGCPTYVFPSGRLRNPIQHIKTVWNLARWIRQQRLDIILAWMSKAHLYAGPAARLAGVPATWWQHGICDGHWIDKLVTRIPARRIFCSSQAAATAQRGQKPQRPTQVIYPAVDLQRFNPMLLPSPEEARIHLGLPVDRTVIGMVARLQPGKGVHVLLEAAQQLSARRSDLFFIVVGGEFALDPGYPKALREQARKAQISDIVFFSGQQVNVPLWMQAMDVVVVPSVEPEGFGMVIIEAMALGKIVVASRGGGPGEIIENGHDGFLVEAGNVRELAHGIECALAQDAQLGAITLAAQARAGAFVPERLACAVAASLREVVSSP